MLSVCLCFVVIVYSARVCGSEGDLTVQTNFGHVRGMTTERVPGKRIHTFLGIPYASPPVKDLRFERPVPPRSWEGVYDARRLSPACIQYDSMNYITEHYPGFNKSSEDCLYLNVYVPEIEGERPRNSPVLVYVHGGSNRVGMGSMLEGDILAGHGGIIVVTFNYRLGIYGFLAAKDEGLEGIYGFLDQVEALKWVKANIGNFGGNSDMITIHGHSAGAADVGFLTTSPLSKGLFQRVIVHSGSPLAFWATTDPKWPQGYNTNSSSKQFDSCSNKTFKACLKMLNKSQLASIQGMGTPRNLITFPAVIDGEFLPERPRNSFSKPLNADQFLIAFAKDEGFPLMKEESMALINHFSTEDLLGVLEHYGSVFKNIKNFTEIVTKEYKEYVKKFPYLLLHRVDADFVFFAPIIRLADLMCQYTQHLYLLSFDHVSIHSPHPDWQGVPHGVDLFYVFGVPLVGHERYKYDEVDQEASRKAMTIFSDFTKGKFDGMPPYQENNKRISHLVSRNHEILIETKDSFRAREMYFWNKRLPSMGTEIEDFLGGANDVKMDHTFRAGISSIIDTQTAKESHNRDVINDAENSSSVSPAYCVIIWTVCIVACLFSL
ncbi:neuroligin-4, X-linked-like isoform X2 [Crassostrea virginica]